jgi:acetoin utilization protein AcuB
MRPLFCVTRLTSAASAAQLFVEHGVGSLPVVELEQRGGEENACEILVGLITRSDLLLAFARYLGAGEPGTQLVLPLPVDSMAPLVRADYSR